MRNVIKILVLLCAAISPIDNKAFAGNEHEGGPRAVTMWWVIFNAPEHCIGNPGGDAKCNSVDVFGEPFLASVANGTPDPSLIAPNMATKPGVLFATGDKTGGRGGVRLTASLYRNVADNHLALPPGVDPMGFGRGLESDTAEVHLVIRDHGRANRSDLLPQITNFLDPYCSDPNLLYFAGDNICADTQFAIFGPTQSGTHDVYAFADVSRPVRRARATLLRDGDSIRAVVKTRLGGSD